jgi:hypothetical protein
VWQSTTQNTPLEDPEEGYDTTPIKSIPAQISVVLPRVTEIAVVSLGGKHWRVHRLP